MINQLTLDNQANSIMLDLELNQTMRTFWSVERFFQITSVVATVNIAVLFLILIALTVPGCSHMFFNISL
ncbi:MAG TPA: hypothetical protein V6C69_09060 [Trichormus sp.]|jgi:hypothetical protein